MRGNTRRESAGQLIRQRAVLLLPHNQKRAVPDGDGSGLSDELVADPQGECAGEDGVPEGVAEAAEGNAPGLAVGAEHGEDACPSRREGQLSVLHDGGGGPPAQEEARRAVAGQIEEGLEVGVGVVQP